MLAAVACVAALPRRRADRPRRRPAADRLGLGARVRRRARDRARRRRCRSSTPATRSSASASRRCCRPASPASARGSRSATPRGRWATSSGRSRSRGSSATRSSALLTDAGSWRLAYAVPATIALLALAAGLSAPRPQPRRVHPGGGIAGVARDPSARRWAVAELVAYAAWTAELTYAGAFYIETYGVSEARSASCWRSARSRSCWRRCRRTAWRGGSSAGR